MMCPARLWNEPAGLNCQRAEVHVGGHVYHSSDSPQIPCDEEVCE